MVDAPAAVAVAPAPKAPTAEELAVGLPPVPKEDPKPAGSQVRWLTDKKRVDTYTLEHPFELGGVEYRTITLRRLTAAEVSAFVTKMRTNPEGNFRYPLYYVEGSAAEISDAVWDALDDDDRFALTEAGDDFLPARFRQAMDSPPASVPATGDTSGNSSLT